MKERTINDDEFFGEDKENLNSLYFFYFFNLKKFLQLKL